MGIPVMILGESGSGKTTSLRNFTPDEIGVIGVVGKPLPFRSKLNVYYLDRSAREKKMNRYELLKNCLMASKVPSIAIDDSQYLMAFDSFDMAKIKGYEKFTNMAVSFKDLIDFVINDLPENKIVYFLHHLETADDGHYKVKTIGKMLDSQLTVEGMFTIVLMCAADKHSHKFITQNDGTSTAKSPIDMLPLEMDNDLKAVDDAIRNYYEIK